MILGWSYLAGIVVGLIVITWAEWGRVNEPIIKSMTFQEAFNDVGLIEESTAEWDTSYVDGLEDNV